MRLAWAAFWVAVYLCMALGPLFVLLVGTTQTNAGFWWDFAIALGFAGTAMMGMQFMLTARFKHAMAPFGIDIIYYFHRYIAVVALVLILAHPIVLASDNPALLGFLNPLRAPWQMTAGLASIVSLTMLMVTSWWRRRLSLHYDAWRRWHSALAIAALGLALAHIGGVGHYVAAPWKRALWTAIGASWLGVIAYVRIVSPWSMLRRPYDVVDVRPERGDAWTVVVRPRGHQGFRYHPGQFAWLTLRASPFAMHEHPFSISSSPVGSEHLEFTIKELGDFTATIKTVRSGETAFVDGPYGAFTIDRHPARGYVFIAGGIGIAPLMGMLRALADRGDTRPIILFYAYRRWERLTCREAIETLRSQINLRVIYVLGEPPEGWDGETGRIDSGVLSRHLPSTRRNLHYFVCGPEAMTEAVERALYDLGVPLGQLHTELFDMA
ncbi:MAG: ferric reductase-like transmembrane domain-containing protein [Vicinamibacterales bacterium]